ncbi:hypothetical protein JTE90_021497 [Oedothorax gibbosus]|uniref:Uncharacterized protein n=1 Tax=Oedothorax gibbosus TaxID=931172 RepID=A0AAV6VNF1_9ARAC|nr:hypothetical protein JTE90_021497 [Oedothorax gibbosus]
MVLDSPRPALHIHIAAGRGNNKSRKGRQAGRVGHAHGIQLTPIRSPMLRSQYAPYSHTNTNFRNGAAWHRGRTTRREAETRGKQARLADTVIDQLNPRSTDTVPHI